jgi:membrane protein DedA with SNARE-associated domain
MQPRAAIPIDNTWPTIDDEQVIAQILEALAVWIQGVISSIGYAGVAGLMAIESACIPLPSEVIMPFAGSLIPLGRFTLVGAGFAGAIGCVIGSIPAYYAGAYGGRPLILRYGRYVLLSREHLDWADKFFASRGDVAVFTARLLPVVRTFIAFPAGVAKMPMAKFIVYTFTGSLPWCLGLAWVGMKLGEHIDVLKPWFHRFDAVIVTAGLAAVVWFVHKQLKTGRALS